MKKVCLVMVCLALLTSCFTGYAPHLSAFTPALVTNSKVSYPISLNSGRDAMGKEVFPDKKFWEYIKQETFRTGSYAGYVFDLDDDGMLSKEECETVRVLSINERMDIKSVEGLEAFPKLRELYCSNSGITELDLSNNPRLQVLTCSNNAITSLDVSVCPLLRELKISGCGLSSLDLHKNTKLELLTCMTQSKSIYEYKQDGEYKVKLADWDKFIDLSRVSQVTIDGAPGDNINSIYDAQTGTVSCSDEIKTISYDYKADLGSVSDDAIDNKMSVTLEIAGNRLRQSYECGDGTKVLPSYVDAEGTDKEPEQPQRDGYRFTGWYTHPEAGAGFQWSFGSTLTGNMTLYAGWEKKFYKVRYDANGGTLIKTEKEDLADWWTKRLLPEEPPEKDGYILTGWQTESGLWISGENANDITYGQASGNSAKDDMTLTAQWEPVKGYQLSYATGFTDSRRDKVENMPEDRVKNGLTWNSKGLILRDQEPRMAGYNFVGWYTSPIGGTRVTEETTYGDIYRDQFTGAAMNQIPTLYARFERKRLTIFYDERGGSKVADRTGVLWGSRNLLPDTKTKRKNYIFSGWKCNGKKVTKKTSTNSISDGYGDAITLTAFWYKKYEQKGKIFKRYGCFYKVTQSNKKGNKVQLIRTAKKRIILRHKVFYNGKFFTVSSIQKKALKKKKVVLRMPKKKMKKYRKMVKKAGGRVQNRKK